MAQIDKIYHQLSEDILEHGYEYKTDNRPQPCVQLSSYEIRIPLYEFPLLTTKKMFTKGIVEELLWFLRGENSIKPLLDKGVNIWNQDAYNFFLKDNPIVKKYRKEDGSTEYFSYEKNNEEHYNHFLQVIKKGYFSTTAGNVGRNYGVQWRDWRGFDGAENEKLSIDQITNLLGNLMKPNPINRRHIITSWNPAETENTALPPCHWAFEIIPQPIGDDKYGFSLKWHQRSCDVFLGIPFNIASYALLAHIIGSLTNMLPLEIIGDLSNVHFYQPHIEVVEEQLERSIDEYEAPVLTFSDKYLSWADSFKLGGCTFDEFLSELSHEDFIFNNYQSYPALKGDMFAPTE